MLPSSRSIASYLIPSARIGEKTRATRLFPFLNAKQNILIGAKKTSRQLRVVGNGQTTEHREFVKKGRAHAERGRETSGRHRVGACRLPVGALHGRTVLGYGRGVSIQAPAGDKKIHAYLKNDMAVGKEIRVGMLKLSLLTIADDN